MVDSVKRCLEVGDFDLLKPYLIEGVPVRFSLNGIPEYVIPSPSTGLLANAKYFGNAKYASEYFEACHRDSAFRERWQRATGLWDDKVVVDVGCGPGNVFANLGGKPKLLIGIDVSRGALEMASAIGYTPLLADAHQMPLRTGFADIVAVNATLHHCDDMARVLAESARLVRPGGLLVVDHDPQKSAWNYKGLALFAYRFRLEIYKHLIPSIHVPKEDRLNALSTEIHHCPGDGVTRELFCQTLEPIGFDVKLYPHNQMLGATVLEGEMGKPPHWRYRLGQRLSGIDSNTPEAALSLMCVARRKGL
ncbi:MAG: class I SAM-dependent methyltransferase [Elainellaceae cyanobacterium]